MVTDNGSQTTNSFTWGLVLSGTLQGAGGVGGLLAMNRDSSVYFPCFDANGNVTEYIDASGTIRAHYAFDAFGNTMSQSGDLASTFSLRFSTKYADDETGLYYYGYRYYAPELGRWVNPDPIREFAFYTNNKLRKSKQVQLYFQNYQAHSVYLFINNAFDGFDVLGLYYNPLVGPGCDYIGPPSPWDIGGYYNPYYIHKPWNERLPDCPCWLKMDKCGKPLEDQGLGKGWSKPSEKKLHKGASFQMRWDDGSIGSGQQCMYDANGALINVGDGAGTPDYFAPNSRVGVGLHIVSDCLFFIFGTEYDHSWRPPNKGKDVFGNPCPPNTGKQAPPKICNPKKIDPLSNFSGPYMGSNCHLLL